MATLEILMDKRTLKRIKQSPADFEEKRYVHCRAEEVEKQLVE